MKHLLLILSLLVVLSSCSQNATQKKSDSSGIQSASMDPQNGSEILQNSGAHIAPITNEPERAKAKLKKTISFGPSTIVEGFNSPIVEIEKTNADFVQLIRCAASYKLRTIKDEDVRSLGSTSQDFKEKEWAWTQALQDSSSCKIVGTHISATKWPDLSTPDGSYYYVAIPCFNKENSPGPFEMCTYDLTWSEPFEFKDMLRAEIREKTRELSEAEGGLNALVDRAAFLANVLEIRLKACENLVASDSALSQFKGGLVMIGLMVGGASLGSFIGPNAAVMGGMMSMMMGGMIINMKLGNLPVDNSCLQGKPTAEMYGTQKKAFERAMKYATKYENYFNVKSTLEELQTVLSQEIPKARARVEKILVELEAIDARTLTIEKALVKANKLGFDPNKPQTYANSGISGFGGGGLQALLQSLGGGQ